MKQTRRGSTYNQRDLVLVPVPFTDLSSHKLRPVVVLSNDLYNRLSPDLLVVAVTSVLRDEPYSVQLPFEAMESGRIPLPSRIKCDRIYSLGKKIIVKKYGRIKREKFAEALGEIKRLVHES
ncbi:MAG: type II toxin-antitoxin system PemK/MazF family toxin [Candidatus Diapherotrites archaeon]|nr:type II toxin-antitoxin system PemK/MazF family toxin [Candidatus Diapherotrites archaeon]